MDWQCYSRYNNTIEDNAKDLSELIRKLDLAPAHIVGASYGTFIALYCVSKTRHVLQRFSL
jgi:pimeloyl-ACP methyl ester carboxylesterase